MGRQNKLNKPILKDGTPLKEALKELEKIKKALRREAKRILQKEKNPQKNNYFKNFHFKGARR